MILRTVLTILVVTIFSRGIFELVATKNAGYAVGIASLLLVTVIVLGRHLATSRGLRFYRGPESLFLLLYAVIAVVSLCATALVGGPVMLAAMYTALHLFLLTSILLLSLNSNIQLGMLILPVMVTAIVVLVSGLLEIFGIVQFPGSWEYGGFTRIAGSLGSKQHYSFASAALSVLLFWFYMVTGKKIILLLSLMLGVMTFVSFSRNGIPIIIGTYAIYYMSNIGRLFKHLWKQFVIVMAVAVLMSFYVPERLDVAIERTLSILSFEDQANSIRLDQWLRGIEVTMNGFLLFGTEVGLYSQAGSRLGLMDTKHFESALVQQFANYGLIGGFAFLFFFVFFIYSMRDRFLRALAAMVGLTFVYYPGSESLPFIGVWLLIALSDAVGRRSFKASWITVARRQVVNRRGYVHGHLEPRERY